MALAALGGSPIIPVGVGYNVALSNPGVSNTVMDAANEAAIFIGQIFIDGGGTKTLDTSGSSSIAWRSGTVTFANGGTTFKVGIAPVDTGAGPPGRASNAADVISFDVQASFTGGGGGVTTGAWQTSVPTSGSKSIAHGDLVAVCFQMTARGGADSVLQSSGQVSQFTHRPTATQFTGGSYAAALLAPNFIITFSDGTLGYMFGSDIFSTISTRTWNSGSSPSEFGQLYQFADPVGVYGIYGWLDPDADCDIVLYSDPLGSTPVAEQTISIDANTTAVASGRKFTVMFPAMESFAANTPIAAVFKPGGSNVSAYYKTLASATHRIADPGGTSSYGISRSGGSGAFANANSSLDQYYIGLIVGSFDDGTGAGGLATPVTRSPMFG